MIYSIRIYLLLARGYYSFVVIHILILLSFRYTFFLLRRLDVVLYSLCFVTSINYLVCRISLTRSGSLVEHMWLCNTAVLLRALSHCWSSVAHPGPIMAHGLSCSALFYWPELVIPFSMAVVKNNRMFTRSSPAVTFTINRDNRCSIVRTPIPD